MNSTAIELNGEQPVELHVATPYGELAALQWGEPGGAPLLALHGWLDNAESFTRLAPRLAAQRRVIALDLPGHGHSAHLPPQAHRYHVVDQVDVVLAAAEALGLERFDLLGHSLGAGIASLVAAAAPARVGQLLLIEGLGPLADDGSHTLERLRAAVAQPRRKAHAPHVYPSVDAAVAVRVAVGGLDADEARGIVQRNLRATEGGYAWRSDARLRLPTPLRMEEAQVRRLLRGIEAQTLLLLAKPTTPYLPTALLAARAACVADIRVEHVHGPHHLHVHCPGEVAALAGQFLTPKGRTQGAAHLGA